MPRLLLLGVSSYFLTLFWWCPVVCSVRTPVFYADDGFAKTVPFPMKRNQEVRMFQELILQLLGLNRAPGKPRKLNKSAPLYMLDLYRNIVFNEDSDGHDPVLNPGFKSAQFFEVMGENGFYADTPTQLFDYKAADTIITFVNSAAPRKGHNLNAIHHHLRHKHYDFLSFDAPDTMESSSLIGAELHLSSNHSNPLTNDIPLSEQSTLKVYSQDGAGEEVKRLISSVPISMDTAGWVVLNVTEALQRWMENSNRHLQLLLEVERPDGSRTSPRKEFGLKNAFMVGFFNAENDKAHTRIKRSVTPPSSPPSTEKPPHPFTNTEDFEEDQHYNRMACRLKNLYVSFKDLGWSEWIIAPAGFSANFCDGLCTFPLHVEMNATNHAIIQTLVNVMDPRRAPQPKCAPTQLATLPLLYYDYSNNVVLKKYGNMIVKSCGCQ